MTKKPNFWSISICLKRTTYPLSKKKNLIPQTLITGMDLGFLRTSLFLTQTFVWNVSNTGTESYDECPTSFLNNAFHGLTFYSTKNKNKVYTHWIIMITSLLQAFDIKFYCVNWTCVTLTCCAREKKKMTCNWNWLSHHEQIGLYLVITKLNEKNVSFNLWDSMFIFTCLNYLFTKWDRPLIFIWKYLWYNMVDSVLFFGTDPLFLSKK